MIGSYSPGNPWTRVGLLLGLIAVIVYAQPQWDPVRVVSAEPEGEHLCWNNAHCIAVTPGVVHTVFYTASGKVRYARSTDNGQNWAVSDLGAADSGFASPAIAVTQGQYVHVVWEQMMGNWDLWYQRSTDAGLSWEPMSRFTDDPSQSRYPSIAACGSNVSVAWQDYTDSWNTWSRTSTDNGTTWQHEAAADLGAEDHTSPSVAYTDPSSILHIIELEGVQVWHNKSTDFGQTWLGWTHLSPDTQQCAKPCISGSGQHIAVTWTNWVAPYHSLWTVESYDEGATWLPPLQFGLKNAGEEYASVCASGASLHFVDQDDELGGTNVTWWNTSDSGATWKTGQVTNSAPGHALFPNVWASSGDPAVHVVWEDSVGEHPDIHYRRSPDANAMIYEGSGPATCWMPLTVAPNPSRRRFKVDYALHCPTEVSLAVYNSAGVLTRSLRYGRLGAGAHSAQVSLEGLPPSVYLLALRAGTTVTTTKLVTE
jgi:hypothetical protein